MVQMEPVTVDGVCCVGITVKLPLTTLLVVSAPNGYVMCGLLDTDRLDELHPERSIVAARVTGVKTIADVLAARIDAVTAAGREKGVAEGMTGREALAFMV